jgi:tRNA A37 N6-isopentenylltransferase MiaA
LQQALRNLRYHPEAKLELATLAEGDRQRVSQLLEQKQTWIHTTKTADNAATRHRHIVSSNTALAAWTAPQREQLEAELSDSLRQLRANQLLDSREYPFCLFPREQLRIFLLDFLSRMA